MKSGRKLWLGLLAGIAAVTTVSSHAQASIVVAPGDENAK
jgi:hypothetical protein